MKRIIIYAASILVLCSCTSDDLDSFDVFEPEFTFEISGLINKTMSGKAVVYFEKTTPVKNANGEDTQLTTLTVIAQDGEDQVIFAVTREANEIGTGNYTIGSDILTFQNAFMNFSGDKGATIAYQSESGIINFSSRAVLTTGSVDVYCGGYGGGDGITITGTFAADSAD